METTTTQVADLNSIFDQVAPSVGRRLEAVANENGQKLIAEPVRPLFSGEGGRDIICRSWKIVSRLGVAFALELIGTDDQATVLVRVDGAAVLELDRRGAHADELACAQVGLALDVALLEAA